jgi:hypothetical protein
MLEEAQGDAGKRILRAVHALSCPIHKEKKRKD